MTRFLKKNRFTASSKKTNSPPTATRVFSWAWIRCAKRSCSKKCGTPARRRGTSGRDLRLKTCDFLVIGGGVIGINVAWQLKKKNSQASVVVIEKESAFAAHASGRNSGVLHAGFYYTADSLKARFTRIGNRLLTEYCERKKLPIRRCGKLVVAKDASDLPQLDELV